MSKIMEVHTCNNNNFCVETKGVCFFCFHENPNPSHPPKGGVHDRDCDIISYNISLKRLSKYLCMDFRKVFKLNIPLQYKNIGTSDVLVPLCEECATVTRKFSKLHHELELLKMHVHSCIHTIREKMVKADSEQDLTVNYKKRWLISDPVDAIQAQIVDNLRKETKEKCFSKIGNLLPRVKLEKLTSKRNSRKRACACETAGESAFASKKSVIMKKVDNAATNPRRLPLAARAHDRNDSLKQSSTISPNASPTAQSQLSSSQPNVPRSTVVLKSSSNCKNISQAPSSVPCTTSSLLPPPPPPPSIRAPPPNLNNQPQPFLSYVPVSSSSSSLPLSNADELANSKNTCQRSNKSTEKPKQPIPAEGSYDCVHCEDTFADKSTLRTHVVRSHCEQFFTTLKDRNLSSDEFKSIVYMLFKDVAKSHTVNNTHSPSKASYSCPRCHITHESDGDVYAHMFRFHYTDLTSKLLALQKETLSKRGTTIRSSSPDKRKQQTANRQDPHNSSLLCTCGNRYASKRTLAFHKKYNCKFKNKEAVPVTTTVIPPKEVPSSSSTPTTSNSLPPTFTSSTPAVPANQFHCTYCAKSFPFYYDHRVHLLTNHRIEEFSKYVSPGVTSQQVDTELTSILHAYRKLPGNDNAGGCLFCSEVFSKVMDLQNHILVGHFDVVVFKLRGILPEHTLYTGHQSNDNNVFNINNDTGGVGHPMPSINGPVINESLGSVNMPVKEDTTPPLNCDTFQIIMEDPLSLDFIELDPDVVLCQEEEQLKMEWLFSFIDEDGTEIPTQPPQPPVTGDEKGFILGNNDSELILP